jgi:NitT/TauT family transport system substrate-binding protein
MQPINTGLSWKILSCLLLVSLLAAPAHSWSAGASKRVPLSVAYGAISAIYAPVWVAQDEGIFEKHGLEVAELQYIRTSPTLAQGLLAGSVDVGGMGVALLDARLAGSDLTFIAGAGGTFIFSVYGRPELKSAKDLVGKTVAASKKGSTTDLAVRMWLEANGLVPDKDVKILFVGGVPEIMAAVKQNLAAAGVVSPPTTLRAKKAGLKEIANLAEQKIPYIQSAWATTETLIRRKPEGLRRFVYSLTEAIAVVKQKPDIAMKAIGKYTKEHDQEIVREAYAAFVNTFPRIPKMTEAELRAAVETNDRAKAEKVNPLSFYDSRFLDELERSGVVDSFYK